jgi:decaprenylphospho-beta-D-ribofuranose 2-oxidase
MFFQEQVISGWGNIPHSKSKVAYPREDRDIIESLLSDKIIPRGLGRSYADQSTNTGHRVLALEKMNKFLAFDATTGILECEAGVSLDEIIEALTPKGWFPMITPGTKYISIGGAIANDIHGKAHHADGSFVNCVLDFTILLADGRIVKASREENADLFWANFGGLGLLGVILTARIQLRKIETTYFVQKAYPAKNLDDMLQAIDDSDKEYTSSVAWIDSLAKGKDLGRGVLTMPAFSLNTFTVSILNVAINFMQKNAPRISHYDKFFYPLDMINNWNRGYGRRGFIQYQFVIPVEKGRENIRKILIDITQSGCVPFLNVLKKFGKGQGLLSFPFEGYTFAIDFPVTSKLKPFTQKMDQQILDMGGRIYLGKDAYLDEAMFKAMYPQYREWLEVKKKYDPNNVFSSDLSRRIGLELR